MARGSKVERRCANRSCGVPIFPRAADVARGWGRFCSKSCKAAEQERRTHQHANHIHRAAYTPDGYPTFNDAHLFSNEEHDCNKPL